MCLSDMFHKLSTELIQACLSVGPVFSIETLKQREELRTDGEFIAGLGVPGQRVLLSYWPRGLGHCAIIGWKHM